METQTLKPEDFKVSRHAAAKFLGISDRMLMKLDIPFFRIGDSLIKFRQVDLDRIRDNSIHNAGSVAS